MNKKSVFIIIIICLGFCICFNLANGKNDKNLTAKDKLIEEDFEIAGVKLGMNISETSKILGNPKKITSNTEAICYSFPQLLIKSFRIEGTTRTPVNYIRLLDKNLKTVRNIGIGSTEEEVIYRYGKNNKIKNRLIYEKEEDFLMFNAISFLINKGKVKQIEIYIPAD